MAAYIQFQKSDLGIIQLEFFRQLDRQINKCTQFYNSIAQGIVRETGHIIQNREYWNDSNEQLFGNMVIDQLTNICNAHKNICEFVEMNITAIRKILKKFDKKMSNYSIPMQQKYIESRMIPTDEDLYSSRFKQLLSHTVLFEIYLVLEDCMKQIKTIVNQKVKKLNKESKDKIKKRRAQTFNVPR